MLSNLFVSHNGLMNHIKLRICTRHAEVSDPYQEYPRPVRLPPAGAPELQSILTGAGKGRDGERGVHAGSWRAPPLPIFDCTLICLRLGSTVVSAASTERGDESGIVRRPRRGLYSPSLDISRETTPSSAPDERTVHAGRWLRSSSRPSR
jgi:hypothetical protein